ncbi:MAG: HAD-IA family hydrolase [Arcanobacterium sp.]|nr:HAD-IA family hydrolase [Arcanobacterium sp.]
MAQLRAILWDLDGTLTDSAPLIMQCVAGTMKSLAGVDRPPESYHELVGPPLLDGFRLLGVAEDDLVRYVHEYRRRYNEVRDETPLFPGVVDVLHKLAQHQVPMAVATSKQENLAQQVCEVTGIAPYFTVIAGAPSGTEPSTKGEVVRSAIERLNIEDLASDAVVMIGDRIYDIRGAEDNGIRTILVTWGSGTPEEWALAWRTVETPDELLELLLA